MLELGFGLGIAASEVAFVFFLFFFLVAIVLITLSHPLLNPFLCQIERVGVKEHWIVECNSGVFSTLLDWSVNQPAVVVPLQGLAEEVRA